MSDAISGFSHEFSFSFWFMFNSWPLWDKWPHDTISMLPLSPRTTLMRWCENQHTWPHLSRKQELSYQPTDHLVESSRVKCLWRTSTSQLSQNCWSWGHMVHKTSARFNIKKPISPVPAAGLAWWPSHWLWCHGCRRLKEGCWVWMRVE